MGDNGGREPALVQRVRARLRANVHEAAPRVLAGVSGGADSVALLAVLRDLARAGVLSLTAVHVDHRARPDSTEDAVFVADLCARLGVRCRVVRLDAGADQRHAGVGAEESWRRERYRAFSVVADETGTDVVALAHHRRDQAETVLLHLFRGAGLRGVSGMAPWSTMRVPWWSEDAPAREVTIWRPVLEEDPAVLRAYLVDAGIAWREDASNLDPAFRRNAVRGSVLPAIDAVFPGAEATIGRFADLARVDDDALDALAAAWLDAPGGEGGLERAALREAHRAIGRRIVRRWLGERAGAVEVPLERIDAVLDAAVARASGQSIDVGSGWWVEVGRTRLVLHPPE